MAIPGKHADLIRRFKLYAFGLLLGTLIVSFVYKGKGCQMPGSAKMEELSWQQLQITEHGDCVIKCKELSADSIKNVLKTGKVNYDKSNVRGEPLPMYAIEGFINGKPVRLIIEDNDTISQLVTVFDFSQDTDEVIPSNCDCE